MTNSLNFFGPTVKKAVTNITPVTPFTPGENEYNKRQYVLVADADCQIERNGAATANSLLLPAKTYVQILLQGTDTLSYITATTANLWIAQIAP
jgi:hypothetical protein